ncbi:MAG: hypothetical protein AAF725_15790 [Acidobacteriota bacterium]
MLAAASLRFAGPALASEPAGSGLPQKQWQVASETALPAALAWARVVRHRERSKEVLIADLYSGLYRWRFEASEEPTRLVRQGNGQREIWQLHALGISERYFAIGAPALVAGWGQIAKDRWEFEGFEAADLIMDLDVAGETLLMLAPRRNKSGDFAPDGAIAWMGSISKDLEDLRPVLFSEDGPGADSVGRCGMISVGSARFLADGSFLVVPGVEDGAYHLGPEGKLMTVWSSESIGYESGCPLSEEEEYRLAVDEPARWSWINGRPTVDEILPLESGPGIVLREMTPDGVGWKLAQRAADGNWVSEALPLSSSSKWAHISGDVNGDRLTLLVWAYGLRSDGPEASPRLVILERR